MGFLTDKPAKTFGECLMEMGECIKPLYDFIDGQKKEIVTRGYNEHIAERMAAELFTHMLWMMRGGK